MLMLLAPPEVPRRAAAARLGLLVRAFLLELEPVAADAARVVVEGDVPVLGDEAVRDEVALNPALYAAAGGVDGGVLEAAGAVAGPVVLRLRGDGGRGRRFPGRRRRQRCRHGVGAREVEEGVGRGGQRLVGALLLGVAGADEVQGRGGVVGVVQVVGLVGGAAGGGTGAVAQDAEAGARLGGGVRVGGGRAPGGGRTRVRGGRPGRGDGAGAVARVLPLDLAGGRGTVVRVATGRGVAAG